jgi:shikimate kinase
MKNHITLIGLRASGKSTIGKSLALTIGAIFIDVDKKLIQEAGAKSMIDAIRSKGKHWLVETENTLLKKLLASDSQLVLATGGRTFSHEFPEIKKENIKIVKKLSTTVLLLASEKEMWSRIVKDRHKEHAHLDEEKLRQNFIDSLYFLDIYKKNADIIVETDNKIPEEVIDEIKKLLKL